MNLKYDNCTLVIINKDYQVKKQNMIDFTKTVDILLVDEVFTMWNHRFCGKYHVNKMKNVRVGG